MTAESLKDVVREYADEHFPGGWDAVSVCVTRGIGREPETLIVVPARPREGSSPDLALSARG